MDGFSLEKEHFKTIRDLRNKKDLVIMHPDKGKGVVIMKRERGVQQQNDEHTEGRVEVRETGTCC